MVSNPLKKPENTIENIPTRIDRAVFPWIQWWPHMNTIAAIAVALWEAQTDKFKEYAIQALKNSKVMAEEFINRWYKLVTWGTDNHMVILDFSNTPIENGKNAEYILDLVGISTSKSTIPDDPNPPFRPSGLRIGTPAMTTRGVKEDDIRIIVDFIDQTLKLIPFMQEKNFSEKINKLKSQVIEFSKQFPVPRIN